MHPIGIGGRTRRWALALLGLASTASAGQPELSPEEKRKVEEAVPAEAPAKPAKARRLLVFDLNVNYGGHGSIPYANHAFTVMGERTGAFTAVVSRDPAAFRKESLAGFDAVLLNNTVGDLFDDEGLREAFRAFIHDGGGLLGYHGSSVAFQKWPGAVETWPEFGRILGARGCTHREPDERAVLKVEDPASPITKAFAPGPLELRDEFFRFTEPYSRERLHVLLSFDTAKMDLAQGRGFGNVARPDGDYAVSWIREYGKGRVFYASFGHNPAIFKDRAILRFWLAAIQYALGDLPADASPSAKPSAGK
jgi:type 1 glutamine amidotransferase